MYIYIYICIFIYIYIYIYNIYIAIKTPFLNITNAFEKLHVNKEDALKSKWWFKCLKCIQLSTSRANQYPRRSAKCFCENTSRL